MLFRSEAQPKSEPAELLDSIIRELTAEAEVETEITSLGDKAAMLEQAKELITYIAKTNAMFAGMSQDPNAKKRFEKLLKSMEPMLDRLAALQEPELALIIAMLTGKNWLKIWATAIGWKFENSIVDIKAI